MLSTGAAFKEIADTVITGDVRLPAIVTLPKEQDAPIVVMVHGSGATDRDETVYENKPFRDIATKLADCGIATLRYDKRTFIYRREEIRQAHIHLGT